MASCSPARKEVGVGLPAADAAAAGAIAHQMQLTPYQCRSVAEGGSPAKRWHVVSLVQGTVMF